MRTGWPGAGSGRLGNTSFSLLSAGGSARGAIESALLGSMCDVLRSSVLEMKSPFLGPSLPDMPVVLPDPPSEGWPKALKGSRSQQNTVYSIRRSMAMARLAHRIRQEVRSIFWSMTAMIYTESIAGKVARMHMS